LFLNKTRKPLTTHWKIELPEFEAILGSEKKFFYRNKMEFSFSNSRWLTEKKLKVPKILETEMH
jgi:23S rRNA (uracil1939-C5)-methyltransferase